MSLPTMLPRRLPAAHRWSDISKPSGNMLKRDSITSCSRRSDRSRTISWRCSKTSQLLPFARRRKRPDTGVDQLRYEGRASLDPLLWIAFAGTVILAQIPPGPDSMLVMARGIGHGRRAALFIVLGMTVGAGLVQLPLVALGVAFARRSVTGSLQPSSLAGSRLLDLDGSKAPSASMRQPTIVNRGGNHADQDRQQQTENDGNASGLTTPKPTQQRRHRGLLLVTMPELFFLKCRAILAVNLHQIASNDISLSWIDRSADGVPHQRQPSRRANAS